VTTVPYLGVGVGLRRPYFSQFESQVPKVVHWVEVIAENYTPLKDGTLKKNRIEKLLKVREQVPVVLHSVSLSLGSTQKIDLQFLNHYKLLIDIIKPPWISDHLCFTNHHGIESHDLLPLPYTKESLNTFVNKIDFLQSKFKVPFLVENVSSYLEFKDSEMEEWDFINQILKKSGCGLLLDINNVYVSSINHGFSAKHFLEKINKHSIAQIHLAGHYNRGDILIDTHAESICDDVWTLYQDFIKTNGSFNTMIERDDQFPPWSEIELDLKKVEKILKNAKK